MYYHKCKENCSGNVFTILAGTITPHKYSLQNVYHCILVTFAFGDQFAMDLNCCFQPVCRDDLPAPNSLHQSLNRPVQKLASQYKWQQLQKHHGRVATVTLMQRWVQEQAILLWERVVASAWCDSKTIKHLVNFHLYAQGALQENITTWISQL